MVIDILQGLVVIVAVAGVVRLPRHPPRRATTIYGIGWLFALVAITRGQQPEWLVVRELMLSVTLLATALVTDELARRRDRRPRVGR